MKSKTLEESIFKMEKQILIKETFIEGFEKQIQDLVKEVSPVDSADELETLCHQIKSLKDEISRHRAVLTIFKDIQREIR